jgi:RNA polymerase sigma-70 factor (ECF subfamily)
MEHRIVTDCGWEAGAEERPSREPLPMLLRQAKAGDVGAFEQLMSAYERRVFTVALRLLHRPEDAQDAAQEVFFRFYRNLGRLDESRDLTAWLYRVTVNVCRDIGRKRSQPAGSVPVEPVPGPEAQAALAQQTRILADAVRRLPEKERAALVLRDLEGLPAREVARILGSSEGTVRSQISAARLKIRKLTEQFLRGRK